MEVSGKRLLLAAVLICRALYHNLAITRIFLLCIVYGPNIFGTSLHYYVSYKIELFACISMCVHAFNIHLATAECGTAQ